MRIPFQVKLLLAVASVVVWALDELGPRHPDPQVQALLDRFERKIAGLAPRAAAREAARRL